MTERLLEGQRAYYRARAAEYDAWFLRRGRYDRGDAHRARWEAEVEGLERALAAFRPTGDILELACGTGWWTERLSKHGASLTAVDASPEVLELNKKRVTSNVTYLEADLFVWEPERTFDTVFFSFWLSHVPPERFAAFWETVRRCLAPGGRVFFIDSRYSPEATAKDHQPGLPENVSETRKLDDGRSFEIVKVFYQPGALGAQLGASGWRAAVGQTETFFLYGVAEPEYNVSRPEPTPPKPARIALQEAQMTTYKNSFGAKDTLSTGAGEVTYYRLAALAEGGIGNVDTLPFSIKVLLESLLRNENGYDVTDEDVRALAAYDAKNPAQVEIPFKPARVILQDFTGVPAVVDLAALRSAMERMGGDPQAINPQIPVDLVIDHSVQVDEYDSPLALATNAAIEFERNRERYEFLRWGQKAFANFSVVPPASGIVHQVNLEYIAKGVQTSEQDGTEVMYPDSLVGTDSHTTMINGLGVVGWGVGGIEAEAVMLGQPIYMLTPEVVGFKITGKLPEGSTATDLALVVTQMLRQKGVVGKFVEFYGSGLSSMSLPDRATIANMAPEYGATMGFFPVDAETLRYLRQTGRLEDEVEAVEHYSQAQGLFRTDDTPDPVFQDTLGLDLSTVQPSLAGPKRPQDRILLSDMKREWQEGLQKPVEKRGFGLTDDQLSQTGTLTMKGQELTLKHGDVVIAAITSCTNTSNPSVMMAAGLVAKKAVEAGLTVKPYVKTSLAPGSKVVTEYLNDTGLTPYLEQLGFYTVGYGCTTCIGNSGPLPEPVVEAINGGDLVAASVLSGNRNFEGRINPHVRANYLASPPLVVAYAIAGTVDIDLSTEPLGQDKDGQDVFLRDLWPTFEDITEGMNRAITPEVFKRLYEGIEESNETWNAIPVKGGDLFAWDDESNYIREPSFFEDMSPGPEPIKPIGGARVLVKVGDSVTTDHISPAGAISKTAPAGEYLMARGVAANDFNSYGSRRGNDQVMTRGTFANIRLKNQMAPGTEGGYTTFLPTGEVTSIYEAALKYGEAGTPTVVLAGNDYGMGSSRDWAAKGTFLLGVKAVIAETYERIHRSNLVGMGVLPLQYADGESAESLGLTGQETFSVDVSDDVKPQERLTVSVQKEDGSEVQFEVVCRLDTPVEIDYYRNGGILQTVLRAIMQRQEAQTGA